MKLMFRIAKNLGGFLASPRKVFWSCMVFLLVSLVLSGSLLRVYGLRREQSRLTNSIAQIKVEEQELANQLKAAQDPTQIERQAMNLYDLAEADDLVFVFSED